MVTIPIVRNWHVKTPELIRYMDQQYIDEFFESGRLRLSSFSLFAKHSDEQRGDSEEGRNVLVGFGQDNTVMVLTQHGHKSIILSTSTVEDESLMQAFGTSGYFLIKDSTAFGATVANRIPGFMEGIEGFCI